MGATALLRAAAARTLLPLALLSANIAPPEGHWRAPRLLAAADVAPLAILALLALSNGVITALVFTGGPTCEVKARRGAAATAITACLVLGISAGSALSVLLALALQR